MVLALATPPPSFIAPAVAAAAPAGLGGVSPLIGSSPLLPWVGPAPAARATLRPPGSRILGDAEAAALVHRSPFEPRPENGRANSTVPTPAELVAFRAKAPGWGACSAYLTRVTGDFVGTTDEIIQWAARKWGLDELVLRADAAVESYWRQSFVGDAGQSFGLMQVKRTASAGTSPLAARSTAFNADYYAASVRQYYDGCATWLRDTPGGASYGAGDLSGAIGAWYAGRWHTPAADGYVAKVRDALTRRVWTGRDF